MSTSLRSGIALPVALAAIIVLAAVAALSDAAARAALRESAAEAADTREARARVGARIRLDSLLAHTTRAGLLADALVIAGDTTVVTTPLVWPWHRVEVRAAGAPLVAEFARALVPRPPSCAAIVVVAMAAVPPAAVTLDPPAACAHAVDTLPAPAVDAFADSLAALATTAVVDTLYIGGVHDTSAVAIARHAIIVAPWSQFRGVVVAPRVVVGGGAELRGMIVAHEVAGDQTATVVGDALDAAGALAAIARLVLLGPRGRLLGTW